MARNGEKAQSMLYRFREQQAAEMGISSRRSGERRPRMASSVSSLRDCERYRGDVLKEISRKVTKIQDSTMTDYEVRDLNDEINSLMREKRHWETQIVALGGANYKRAQTAMTDDAGREVPGTRGYKYFGRAKDLPGVKELFQRGKESARNASFQMYRNQGPDYYGDVDEVDAELVREEDELAREAAVAETAEILSISEADVPYPIATSSTGVLPAAASSSAPAPGSEPSEPSAGGAAPAAPEAAPAKKAGKRKTRGAAKAAAAEEEGDAAAEGDGDADGNRDAAADAAGEGEGMEVDEAEGEMAKKARTGDETQSLNGTAAGAGSGAGSGTGATGNTFAASFGGIFAPESLVQPVMPEKEAMGRILLEVRKKALREEYGV